MKTISMTELRSEPGERVIDIIRDRESFLLTKAGKPVARLLPVDDDIVIESDGRIKGEVPMTFRKDLGDYY